MISTNPPGDTQSKLPWLLGCCSVTKYHGRQDYRTYDSTDLPITEFYEELVDSYVRIVCRNRTESLTQLLEEVLLRRIFTGMDYHRDICHVIKDLAQILLNVLDKHCHLVAQI